MSSVTRFLRQIPTGLSYYTATAQTQFYEFVPTVSNYVGNYTPGAMVTLSLPVAFVPATMVLRDMGKTIKASVASSQANAQAGVVIASTEGFYREYQVLTPVAGPDGTFGVRGGPSTPDAYSQYYTVYLPTTVGGAGSFTPGLSPIAGGQM
jgi:hypothetical protein